MAGVWHQISYLNGRYERGLTEIHIYSPFDLKFGMCVLTCTRNLMAGVWHQNFYLCLLLL